ncbi:conserved Plasmodium protein, unknown function [Plasmodium gallinaceum]|uniref:Uncharacterized protein n=1 Tax=Plasmodium gallinaceum TaxID=5849 RepID=A0A1J1GW30_PLAGA|nr:conserved Plasmodium protein, unknown function [Plasmodium gallinaceum]CRG96470.1 conserved Plasmodium protein, unknown function [Plasmodium gallinaceum]
MNIACNFLNYMKNFEKIKRNNSIISKKISITLIFRNYTNEKELKNKDINRKKKQKSWMKKINVNELPRKKFGNKLGTIAKKEYLKYLFEISEHKINCDQLNNHEKNYRYNVILNEKNANEKINIKVDYKNNDNVTCLNNDKLSSEQINKETDGKINMRFDNKSEISFISNNNLISKEYLNTYNKVFWDDVRNELKHHLPFLQPYSITTALNYLSKINYDDYSIFKFIAERIDERWLKNFNIKDLTLLLLSYSRLNLKFNSFINLISRELLYKICYANFEDLSHIAYSYTKMKIYDYEVFLHLGNETKDKINSEMSKISYKNSNNNNSNDSTDKQGLLKEKTESESFEKYNNHDEIKHHIIDSKNTVLNIKDRYNKDKSNEEQGTIKMNTLNHKENENKDNLIKENKKYSHLCLLVYCFGKMKHCDNNLFDLVSEYVKVEKLNNIDLSNLSYTFSLYNFYKNSFYEKFSIKSYEIIDLLEPLQKIIIMTYLLKYPKEKMLNIYFTYLESINKEIKEKEIYKEAIFLNVCINSLSNSVFLNFLFKIVNTSEHICEKRLEELNKVYFILKFLVNYTNFFMNNKKKISSRDYPKILNILYKIYDKGNFLLLYDSKKLHIEKVEVLISNVLDKILNEIKKLHILDLINIKNILNSNYEKIKFAQKIKTILNSISLIVK